ncbi:MAG TPA: uroporphyrinogen decarboxylase family protein, partial [Anaerolineales bacterium]|nr:uroporphyrinogen decarboxylase family protein [Anaerolineales bacterium]
SCLNGEILDRPPVALWRHFPVDDQDPQLLAAATLYFQHTYDFDLVKVTPASSFCAKDWGVEDQWMGDTEGTRRYTGRVIQNPRDWERLPTLDPTALYLEGQLDCLRFIRAALTPDTPLLQTIFSPLAQAKNLAGNDILLAHLRLYPEAVMKGLATIAETTRRFVEACLDTGIDGIFYAIQHAQATLLTLAEYRTFGLPYDQQAIGPAQELWCNLLHLHGHQVYFSVLDSLKFQIVNWHDRETLPSLAEAQKLFSGVTCGGMRQDTLVYGNQAEVHKEAADAIQQTNGKRFILGTGCVVPVIASHGNISKARESVE